VKIVIAIEVKSDAVRTISGVAKRTGKPYNMREQSGWCDLGKPYPVEVRWVLQDDKAPLPVGRYVLDETSVYVDRNGSLQINIRDMKPLAAAASQARTG
jgi:hypothetical protein